MVCARECPVWCIHIASHAAAVDDPGNRADGPGNPASGSGRRRERAVHVLDRFSIDFGVCMYCGICVDACPFDALAWTPDPVPPQPQPRDLVLDKDQLTRAWARVGEPGPLEVGAVPPVPSPRGSRRRG